MSTVLTDRTLSYMNINQKFADKEALLNYINGVFSCGADYVEINSGLLELLDGEDLSEKYILQICSVKDIKLCVDHKFAYVSIPADLSVFFDKLSVFQNIIAEVQSDKYSIISELLDHKEHDHFRNVSMIRLTGLLSSDEADMKALLGWCRFNFHQPIDICPLNTMLSGSSDALDAFNCDADAVSLSFGRNHYYTSFEDFLINRQIMRRSVMTPESIAALCNASLAFMKLFCTIPSGMERLAIKDGPTPSPVYDIEKGLAFRPFKPGRRKLPDNENIIERQIRTIGLEREIEDAIIDMLKKTNYSFYQNIIKRNFID
ncbi:MAG: hypothetical protein J6A41_06705 [Ruminiclostridium sp.]|nr:hypothetical protein [Ruminiclostridium sp.]